MYAANAFLYQAFWRPIKSQAGVCILGRYVNKSIIAISKMALRRDARGEEMVNHAPIVSIAVTYT